MDNIASALVNAPHITAFARATAAELADTSFAPLLMYVVDEAPEDALYYLAEQFNVLGWKGWNLATTATARRELIKNAIRLQRAKGTPYAIREAVRTLGFETAVVRENIGVDYDAANNHDGTLSYGDGGGLFTFRVLIYVGADVAINATSIGEITELVLAYKNARSHLIDISFGITLQDTLASEETLEYDGSELSERLTPGVYHTGAATYNGAETHNNTASSVNLRIFTNGTLTEDANY
jgi:phage tail P2-like protein